MKGPCKEKLRFSFRKKAKAFFTFLQRLGLGSIRNRSDSMSEYSIVGFKNCKSLLTKIYPFLHIKKKQAWYMIPEGDYKNI